MSKKLPFLTGKQSMKLALSSLKDCQDEEKPIGLETGLPYFDAISNGFYPGDLIFVAGRPDMGKFAFALKAAEHIAKELPVVFFSTEKTHQQISLKRLSAASRVPVLDLGGRSLGEAEWPLIAEGIGKIAESHFFIDDSFDLDVETIVERSRALCREQCGLGLIVIDSVRITQHPAMCQPLKALARFRLLCCLV